MSSEMYYILCVILLSALLYFPVNKLILVLSIRRLEKKIGQSLSDDERKNQLNRSRFISIILILIFSCLFNIEILNFK
jgi:Na+/H+ antiporter NhaC